MRNNNNGNILDDFEDAAFKDPDHYNRMDQDSRKQVQDTKSDRAFYCKTVGIDTSPSKCLTAAEEFRECANCSTYFLASRLLCNNSDKKENSMTEAAEMEKRTNDAEPRNFDFVEYNPSKVCPLKKSDETSVYLSEKVMYINSQAIQNYHLYDFTHSKFFFDQKNRFICLTLYPQTDYSRNMLKVSFRKGGDAKISFSGFRKQFGVDNVGRYGIYKSIEHEDGRLSLLVDLNKKISED